MRAEELNMDKETVRQISTTNLNMKKCVPKLTQRIRQFLATKQIPPLDHASYSPDLARYDSPPKLKSSLKGTHFQSIEIIRKKTAELLKALSQSDFRRCFQVRMER
jgi:hypothetical protein